VVRGWSASVRRFMDQAGPGWTGRRARMSAATMLCRARMMASRFACPPT